MVRHLRGTGSDAMASAPVAAAGLSKSFELRRGETVPVLRHVDFTAGWGQMTGIVGPSGSVHAHVLSGGVGVRLRWLCTGAGTGGDPYEPCPVGAVPA